MLGTGVQRRRRPHGESGAGVGELGGAVEGAGGLLPLGGQGVVPAGVAVDDGGLRLGRVAVAAVVPAGDQRAVGQSGTVLQEDGTVCDRGRR